MSGRLITWHKSLSKDFLKSEHLFSATVPRMITSTRSAGADGLDRAACGGEGPAQAAKRDRARQMWVKRCHATNVGEALPRGKETDEGKGGIEAEPGQTGRTGPWLSGDEAFRGRGR